MKGMRFPIDFVWIGAGCTVIDVTLGASAPPAGTADSALPLYTPSAPILYALEINAGEVAELGIEVGAPVAFIDFPATAPAAERLSPVRLLRALRRRNHQQRWKNQQRCGEGEEDHQSGQQPIGGEQRHRRKAHDGEADDA